MLTLCFSQWCPRAWEEGLAARMLGPAGSPELGRGLQASQRPPWNEARESSPQQLLLWGLAWWAGPPAPQCGDGGVRERPWLAQRLVGKGLYAPAPWPWAGGLPQVFLEHGSSQAVF